MWVDPVIFSIGHLGIRWYGVVYVFGMLLTYYVLKKNKKKIGLSSKQIDDIILYILIGLLVGGRIFHFLFSQPSVFVSDPLELIRIWHGGMSFFGGLIGVVFAVFFFFRKNFLKGMRVADLVVIPAAFSLFLGRIANFINNELVGTVTSVKWCVNFPTAMGCRHPYQLYASLSHLIMFGILLYIYKIKDEKGWKAGTVFMWFLLIYGVFRFFTDFFREDPRFLMLTVWQYFSILISLLAGLVLLQESKQFQ